MDVDENRNIRWTDKVRNEGYYGGSKRKEEHIGNYKEEET